jgi:UDP-sugar transporter A1/2/3
MFSTAQLPYTLTAAAMMSITPLVMTASKNAAGGFDYSVPSSVLVSEVLKLAISAAMLLISVLRGTLGAPVLRDGAVAEFCAYFLPSAVFFVNNNLVFHILRAVDPTTFQLLSQMKIIFTALLFRVFLKRRLSPVQYLALVILACGTACSQLPSARRRPAAAAAPFTGFCLSMVSSLFSALGGIYNEKLLKGRPSASIHWQNMQMYVWGVGFNALTFSLKDARLLAAGGGGFLAGYTHSAWAVVLCNAMNGLAVSAVLKYADNIARVYAHAVAMMLTMGASVRLFHAPITPQLVLSCVLVATSTLQYNLPPSLLQPAEDEAQRAERARLMEVEEGAEGTSEGSKTTRPSEVAARR